MATPSPKHKAMALFGKVKRSPRALVLGSKNPAVAQSSGSPSRDGAPNGQPSPRALSAAKEWFRNDSRWASVSTSKLVRKKTRREFRSAAKTAIRRSRSEPTLNSWDYMEEELMPKKKKKRRSKKRRRRGSKFSGSDKDRNSPRDYSSGGPSPRKNGKADDVVQRSATLARRYRFTELQVKEMQLREELALDAQREYYSQLPPPGFKPAKDLSVPLPIARRNTREVLESPRRMPVEADLGHAEEEQDVQDIDDDEEVELSSRSAPSGRLRKRVAVKRVKTTGDAPESDADILRRSMSLSHMLEATTRAKKPIESELENLEQQLEKLVERGVSFEKKEEETTRRLIASGSVSSLIDSLVAIGKQDNFFIHEFLSTHKYFIGTAELFHEVCARYTASLTATNDGSAGVRTVNLFRKWIEFYILSFDDDTLASLSTFIANRVIPLHRQWGKLLQTLLKCQIEEQQQHYIYVDHFKGFEGTLQNQFTGDLCSLELLADFIVSKTRKKAGGKKRDIISEDAAVSRIKRALSVSDERAITILRRALVRKHYFSVLTDKEAEALLGEKDLKDSKEGKDSAEASQSVYYQFLGPRVHRQGEEHPKLMLSKRLLYSKPVDFMDIHPVELARQLTLFEQDMFCSIVPYRDLVGVSKGKSGPVRRFIGWSNLLANWTAGEIVQTGNMKKRVAVLKRLIMVADECWKLNNFSSAVSIFQGLQNPSVKRLKLTWKRLPRAHAKMEEDYAELISVLHNFEKLRLAISSAMPPLIPYFALFLRDLSLIELNNDDFVKPEVVNFTKFRMISLQFQEIQALQQQRYMLQRSSTVTRWLITGLVDLSAEKLEEYSKDCENPQDAINFAEGDRVAAYKNYVAIRDRLKRKP